MKLLLPAIVTAQSVQLGTWDVIGESNVVCIHTFVLPNSKILCVERPHEGVYPPNPKSGGLLSSEIDLKGGKGVDELWEAKAVSIAIQNNPFCGGHSQMADGSILMIGGDNKSVIVDGQDQVVNGRQGVRIFKPCSDKANCHGTWENKPDMTTERWYPTVVTLANGEQVIFGGQKKNLDFNTLNKDDDNPTYEYYPSRGKEKTLDLLEWAYPHNMYPQSFVMPSGKVFILVSNASRILDPVTDTWGERFDMDVDIDHSPWIYPHTPNMFVLPMTIQNNFKFELMICGGSDLSTKLVPKDNPSLNASPMCYIINPDDDNKKWRRADDMPNPRLMPDSVILPDGKILMVNGLRHGVAGGNAGDVQYAWDPVFEADLYDPAAPEGKRWSTLAKASQMRLYHSGAVLLETGHVITTGSEMNNYNDGWPLESRKKQCKPNDVKVLDSKCLDPFNYKIERFTPPYLQLGVKRPKIIKTATAVTYGSLVEVEVDNAKAIKRVTFIRTSTTTHSTNTDQRFIELVVKARTDNKLYVTMPDSGGKAPPGNWFLFVLNEKGVPSVAATLNLNIGDKIDASIPAGAEEGSAFKMTITWLWLVLLLL